MAESGISIASSAQIWFYLRQIVTLVPLVLWLGGSVALAFFTAPVVFDRLPRTEAGNLMAVIFQKFDIIGWVTIGCLLLAECIKRFTPLSTFLATMKQGQSKEFWITVLIVIFLLTNLFALLMINPKIQSLRHQIPSFDLDPAADPNPLRKAFGMWHGISVITMLFGLSFL